MMKIKLHKIKRSWKKRDFFHVFSNDTIEVIGRSRINCEVAGGKWDQNPMAHLFRYRFNSCMFIAKG